MKNDRDVADGWLRKARSDLATAELCLSAQTGLDSACVHCQQAAEKAIKAFLLLKDVDFPFTHDLTKLIAPCVPLDPAFGDLLPRAGTLNQYAVTMRYDETFWPSAATVEDALAVARAVLSLVESHFARA